MLPLIASMHVLTKLYFYSTKVQLRMRIKMFIALVAYTA